MHPIFEYDVYIFDCDGVILDSNNLKISAMKNTLMDLGFSKEDVSSCVLFFGKNFGKSRFYHIDYFVSCILKIADKDKSKQYEKILASYSNKCLELYLKSRLTPGIENFINAITGDKFIASGSEQEELRCVFKQRSLDHLFTGIFGSPTKKSELVQNIVSKYSSQKVLLIGDAISDYEASKVSDIDFCCYIPFSNVKTEMNELAVTENFPVLKNWPTRIEKDK